MDQFFSVEKGQTGKAGRHHSQLFAYGNVALLTVPTVGICGSRKASEGGLAYAYELGEIAARHGLIVVSGYASGVDQQAHTGALDAGGSTIAVLAEGMSRFNLRVHHRGKVNASNFLAVSEFVPEAMWIIGRAMQRNVTIISIADSMFVVEAGETGGTLEAGKQTLRLGKPLFVLDFKSETTTTRGNRILLEKGATAVSNRRELKRALELVRSGNLTAAGRLL